MVHPILALSYKDVYGEVLDREEAVRLIKRYELFTILHALSRFELFIIDPSYESIEYFRKNQNELLNHLGSPAQKQDIVRALNYELSQKKVEVGIFSRPQFNMAMKLAFRHCSEESIHFKGKEIPYNELLIALLIINDHFGPNLKDKPPVYFLYIKEGDYTFRDNLEQSLTRWGILAEKVLLSKDVESQNIKEKYRLKHGLSLASYLTVGYYFSWQLSKMRDDPEHADLERGTIFFDLEGMKKKAKIESHKLESVFAEFCQTPKYFQQVFKDDKTMSQYNNVTFLKYPMVRFGDTALCLSSHFLAMKLASGFYWILVNLYDFEKERDERHKVITLFGKVFEQYVGDLLKRVYGYGPLSCLKLEKDIQFARGGMSVDAIINCGRTLVLIECKSSLLKLPIKTCKDGLSKFHNWENEYIIGGAEQIHDVIVQIKNDKIPGYPSSKYTKYYPVIVTLEYLPTPIYSYLKHIEHRLKEENEGGGISSSDDIERITLMSVNELEAAEAPLKRGDATLKEMIDLKNSNDETYYAGWLTFLARNYGKLSNQYLVKEFQRLVKSGVGAIFGPKESPD